MTPPLRALVPGMSARYGTFGLEIHGRSPSSPSTLPSDFAAFVNSCKRGVNGRCRSIAFVSFGSFGHHPRLRVAAANIARILIDEHDYAVVFHETSKTVLDSKDAGSEDVYAVLNDDGAENDEQYAKRKYERSARFHVYRGFVSYDDVVQTVDLVAFTGSMCLQLKCLISRVPMIFVPLLTEQYFWAKNYKHFTGMPYIA